MTRKCPERHHRAFFKLGRAEGFDGGKRHRVDVMHVEDPGCVGEEGVLRFGTGLGVTMRAEERHSGRTAVESAGVSAQHTVFQSAGAPLPNCAEPVNDRVVADVVPPSQADME